MSTQINYSGFASIRNFSVVSQDTPVVTHDSDNVIVKAKTYGYTKSKVIAINNNDIDWTKY